MSDGQATVPKGGFPRSDTKDGLPRLPIYDEPEGDLIGYYFPNAGFVQKELVEAPGFDANSVYEKIGICPPSVDDCGGRPY